MIGLVNGSVYGPGGLSKADVWLEGDTVVAVGSRPGPAEVVHDVGGMLVGPGLVDLHTHLRDPGQTWKEDLNSGSRAAAAGGFTAVVAMPNTDPPIDSPSTVEQLRRRSAEHSIVLVAPAAALTLGRRGSEAVDIPALHAAGVRVYTDDGDWLADEKVLEDLMGEASRLPGAVIAQHAEDPAVSAGGHMHAGPFAERAGIAGIPHAAEVDAVARDLEIAARTGAAYHVQHVSSARTLDLVAEARDRGMGVTMEVTPHHLDFDVTAVQGLDTDFKMYPPLREASDRLALRRALMTGEIDVVATDHAPHTPEEKGRGFADAPRGVIGLETAASAIWEVTGDPDTFFAVLSIRPARIAGLNCQGRPVEPGSPANLMVFDPEMQWVPERFASKSSNSPYRGRRMRGAAVFTIYQGRIVHAMERAA